MVNVVYPQVVAEKHNIICCRLAVLLMLLSEYSLCRPLVIYN